MSKVAKEVNDVSALKGRLDSKTEAVLPPVTATPAAAVAAAKAAGAAVGGGAVCAAGYAAYRAAAG